MAWKTSERATKLEVSIADARSHISRVEHQGSELSRKYISENSVQTALMQQQLSLMNSAITDLKADLKCIDEKMETQQAEILNELRNR